MFNRKHYLKYSLWLITVIALSLLVGACGEVMPASVVPQTATPAYTHFTTFSLKSTQPAQTGLPVSAKTLGQVFPALADLPNSATAIRIQNDYISPQFGYTAHYQLNQQAGSFAGNGTFRAGLQDSMAPALVLPVTIPPEVMHDFLQNLLEIPIEEGEYKPVFNSPNGYPNIGYQLDTPVGTLSFYTTSQNSDMANPTIGDNLPWGGAFAGHNFVITSALASQALAKLKPYLHPEAIQKVIQHDFVTVPPAPNK